jgi:L-aminopeptidase/D-esterase-like protein
MLQFDFPALHVGVAEYDEGPTGATVFFFPKRAVAAVDVRGGAPGTINTDVIRLGYERPFVNAIAFAGGSSYGLAVAHGVTDEIKTKMPTPDQGRRIPVVAGAIIFDLGDRRFSTVTPDYELGRSALRSARPGRFPLGARGAGRFAMQGGWFGDWQYSGQGAAYGEAGPTKVLVFTVVNAFGSIVDRRGQIVRCRNMSASGCGTIADRLSARLQSLTLGAADSAARVRTRRLRSLSQTRSCNPGPCSAWPFTCTHQWLARFSRLLV